MMIRRLTSADHEVCFNLIKNQRAENLFIIGDIEAYGYEQEFQKVWGEFDDTGALVAVLLKYEDNYIPYAPGDFDVEGFAEILRKDPTLKMMSGLKQVTEKFEPYLLEKNQRKRQTYYAKCTKLTTDTKTVDVSIVQQAVPDDAEDLIVLLNSIPEFSNNKMTVERKKRGFEEGVSRSFFIKEDGIMVSTASTAAENSLSAMVVSVATHTNYKKKGHATKCMVKLCSQLLSEEKELCLFYDNPAAGAIYKQIGFEDIGFWMMYTYQ